MSETTHWSERDVWALMQQADPAMRAELIEAWAVRDRLQALIDAASGLHRKVWFYWIPNPGWYCSEDRQCWPCPTHGALHP